MKVRMRIRIRVAEGRANRKSIISIRRIGIMTEK